MLRALTLLLLLPVACQQAPRLRALSESGTVACTGTIVSIATPADGDWRIVLQPEPDSARLLAAGQQHLPCELPLGLKDRRRTFATILAKLRVGARVQVAGFHVADDGEGGIHKLRPWTSLDPFP
jgi:hypothetical protein